MMKPTATAAVLVFRKPSYSKTNNCVEIADTPHGAAVRDTQHRHLGHLEFPTTEWNAFLTTLTADDL